MKPSLLLRLVNPGRESLESGLGREIGEELGVALCVSPEDHLSTEVASSPPNLVCHFFVKKMTEEELREVEKAAVVASDHGLEVGVCEMNFRHRGIHGLDVGTR